MEKDLVSKLFTVLKPQTYRNIIYLLLAFPLGIFYFVFLVTGFALGFGLLVILVGVLVFLFVFATCRCLTAFERSLARSLLGVELADPVDNRPETMNFAEWIIWNLRQASTWRGIFFLMLKFPLGILSFILVITAFAVSFSLLTAPLTYQWTDIRLWGWAVQSLDAAFFASFLGALGGLISLHILNAVAALHRKAASILLT